ncbi:MAG: hypothetical protein JXR07_06620 [Reichenbachiella sp.]
MDKSKLRFLITTILFITMIMVAKGQKEESNYSIENELLFIENVPDVPSKNASNPENSILEKSQFR